MKRLTDSELREAIYHSPSDALTWLRTHEEAMRLIVKHGSLEAAQAHVEDRLARAKSRGASTVYEWGRLVKVFRQAVSGSKWL
jgi:hypothetical protein